QRPLPQYYPGGSGHQTFVDSELETLTPEQRAEIGKLWRDQQEQFPDMKNRGQSFIRILDYIRSGD
ncbi:MAG: hypothetical protein AAF236_15620, partial [Verrucomicrobiota bacterium]